MRLWDLSEVRRAERLMWNAMFARAESIKLVGKNPLLDVLLSPQPPKQRGKPDLLTKV